MAIVRPQVPAVEVRIAGLAVVDGEAAVGGLDGEVGAAVAVGIQDVRVYAAAEAVHSFTRREP